MNTTHTAFIVGKGCMYVTLIKLLIIVQDLA